MQLNANSSGRGLRLPLPAPPSEQAAAREDQTGQSRAGDGPGMGEVANVFTRELAQIIDRHGNGLDGRRVIAGGVAASTVEEAVCCAAAKGVVADDRLVIDRLGS